MAGADPDKVSDRALLRGKEQLGTLGSGNHFLEIEVVEEIFDEQAAAAFGLEPEQICVLIHSGSRGFGYQVCDDYLAQMVKHAGEIGIDLPDRQLACARLNSTRGRDYLAAMACAANYAWKRRWGWGRGSLGCGFSTTSATTSRRSKRFRSTGRRSVSASTGRGRRGPFRRAIPMCRRPTGRWGSQS
jgi:hypothetical protein